MHSGGLPNPMKRIYRGSNFQSTCRQARMYCCISKVGNLQQSLQSGKLTFCLSMQQRRLRKYVASLQFAGVSNKRVTETFQVNGITTLGLRKPGGLPSGPSLLMPQIVHKVLFRAALDAGVSKDAQKRNFILDISNLPKASWTPFLEEAHPR